MTEGRETWTEERLELLKKLWGEGLSASQIATQLGGGVTRSAVLGKTHRLGLVRNRSAETATPRLRNPTQPPAQAITSNLAAPQNPNQGPKPSVQASIQAPAEHPKPAPLPVEAVAPGSKGLTIMEFREGTCRWPLGDPTKPEFRYCGAGGVPGLPYCDHHAQIAYIPSAERKRLRG